MDNTEVAAHLDEIADLLELKGESKYRVIAYRNAARGLENTAEDVGELWASGRLLEIPGIGESIAGKVGELLEKGESSYLEYLRGEIPRGVRLLLTVPGLGASKARIIHDALGIDTVAGLEEAARRTPSSGRSLVWARKPRKRS